MTLGRMVLPTARDEAGPLPVPHEGTNGIIYCNNSGPTSNTLFLSLEVCCENLP